MTALGEQVQMGVVAGLDVLLEQLCSLGDRERMDASIEACRSRLRHIGAELLLEVRLSTPDLLALLLYVLLFLTCGQIH